MKILFVYEWLVKAGAQKYLFEIVRSLKLKGYEVGVVCGINSSNKKVDNKEYYYFKLKNEGVKLYPLITNRAHKNSFVKKFIKRIEDSIEFRLGYNFFSKYFDFNNLKKIESLFSKYDRIEIIDFNTYLDLKLSIDKYIHKSDIHILCNVLQFQNNYLDRFNCKSGYNICYPFKSQLNEFNLSSLKINTTLNFPLSIEFKHLNKININNIQNGKLNIGIFTRIAFNKNIDLFILTLFTLISKYKKNNFHLKIFGFIEHQDYYKSLNNLINFYQLNDNISFENHSEDFNTTITVHNLSLAWFHFSGDFPGYAGIEIASIGLPSLFFNITWKTEVDKDIPLIVVSDIDSLCVETIRLIENLEYNNQVVNSQISFLKNKCDIKKNILIFEKFISTK
jgi:hypothetical protein